MSGARGLFDRPECESDPVSHPPVRAQAVHSKAMSMPPLHRSTAPGGRRTLPASRKEKSSRFSGAHADSCKVPRSQRPPSDQDTPPSSTGDSAPLGSRRLRFGLISLDRHSADGCRIVRAPAGGFRVDRSLPSSQRAAAFGSACVALLGAGSGERSAARSRGDRFSPARRQRLLVEALHHLGQRRGRAGPMSSRARQPM